MRMRQSTVLGIAAIAMIGLLGLQAIDAQQAGPGKVGTVDLQKLFRLLDEQKRFQDDMTQMQTEESKKDEAAAKEIESRSKAIQAGTFKVGSKQFEEALDQLSRLQATLSSNRNYHRAKATRMTTNKLRQLYGKAYAAVAKYGENNSYDLILYRLNPQKVVGGKNTSELGARIDMVQVLYSSKAVDLTAAVATIMNNEYNAGKAPALKP